MKSLVGSLLAALLALSAGAAFAADPVDIGSPWFDSEHVQLNPGSEDEKTPSPQPDTDKDKEKS